MEKLHYIGNAHIDPVWLWRWQDGYSEVLASWRSALDRMIEFEDFHYTAACAVYYQWVEQTAPAMFAEIQQRVKEGRWNIVGGWFLQPDCNMPCGEAFARHALISQRYFKEKFGVVAQTGYNVDSFGHAASLPKILRAGGLNRYVFMRPDKNEKDMPSDLFHWKSDDGSSVLTYRIPTHYNVTEEKQDQIDDVLAKIKADDLPRMLFIGIGNHGGGPSSALVRTLKAQNLPDSVFSTVDRYFDQVKDRSVPVHETELQHHARGCYSTVTYVKEMNRRCEENLLAAERFCMLSNHLVGNSYPQKALNKAWKNLLFNQFHDILAGCSIESSFKDASYLFGEIMSITDQAINRALQSICRKIDTGASSNEAVKYPHEGRLVWEHEILGTPIVVFNPHLFPVEETVAIRINTTRITDENGVEIPYQSIRGEQTNGEFDHYLTTFRVSAPALGYRVYRSFRKGPTLPPAPFQAFDPLRLENDKLLVEFDHATGEICRITEKDTGAVVAKGGFEAILTDETACDTWAHNQFDLGEICGRFADPEFCVLENGPVCSRVRVTQSFGSSVLRRDYTLTEGSDTVKVSAEVDYHEKHKALKFAFPARDEVVCEIPYGTITRPLCNGEEPFGKWFSSNGLAVANDCKYGYDSSSSQVRMTVLRGAIFADHYGARDDRCRFMDQGEHRFCYTIFPFRGVTDAHRRAAVLNMPLRSLTDTFHHGPLFLSYEGARCDSDHLVVTAIKKAEDGTEPILRCFESEGSAVETEISLLGRTISVALSPYGIRTADSEGCAKSLMEWDLE